LNDHALILGSYFHSSLLVLVLVLRRGDHVGGFILVVSRHLKVLHWRSMGKCCKFKTFS